MVKKTNMFSPEQHDEIQFYTKHILVDEVRRLIKREKQLMLEIKEARWEIEDLIEDNNWLYDNDD